MSLGDWAAFASPGGEGVAVAEGLYLSVTCAEDTPWITDEERKAATAGTFLGTYRIDEQRAACAQWKVPALAAGAPRPGPDVPVLLLAGGMDYVTPAAWAHETAAGHVARACALERDGVAAMERWLAGRSS